MKKYFLNPSAKQFFITLIGSLLVISVFMYALLEGALSGNSNLLWFLLPEVILLFNYFLWKNYLKNDMLAYVPLKQERHL
jgi:hypothetical protein